jgi:hypothetical protein
VYTARMSAKDRIVRVQRNGVTPAKQSDMAERVAAVWTLTLQCYGWGKPGEPESKMLRSHARVLRPGGGRH